MKEEKSTLEAILDTLGQIIGAIIIWFVVGAGWNGIHDWYYRSVLGTVPEESSGERFGKGIFYAWILSFVVIFYLITITSQETGSIILVSYLKFNTYFAIVTLIGLVYFFRNLKR